jgi:hypothetical protein
MENNKLGSEKVEFNHLLDFRAGKSEIYNIAVTKTFNMEVNLLY